VIGQECALYNVAILRWPCSLRALLQMCEHRRRSSGKADLAVHLLEPACLQDQVALRASSWESGMRCSTGNEVQLAAELRAEWLREAV
jgi:hypothetical protein